MKNKIKSILLFLSSIIFSFFLAEISLHLIKPELAYQNLPQKVIREFHLPSDITEFTLKKNYSGRFLMSEAFFDSTVQTNSLGFRDNELDDREQILVMGDSFVFGYGVNNGETIPDYLEKIHPNFDFINLGYVAGRSPDSYALFLKSKPTLWNKKVILVIYKNDMSDILNNQCLNTNKKPVPYKHHTCQNIESKTSYITDYGDLASRSTSISKYPTIYSLLKRSYLIGLIRDKILNRSNLAEFNAIQATQNPEVTNSIKDKYSFYIDTLVKYSEKLIIFTIENNDNEDNYFYNLVHEVCLEKKINCHKISQLNKKFKWKRDHHYNSKGNKLIAETISEKMNDLLK